MQLGSEPDAELRRPLRLEHPVGQVERSRPEFADAACTAEHRRPGAAEVDGREFLHPELRFRFVFPHGFTLQNRRDAVLGVSQSQDAAVTIALAAGESPEAAARVFLSREGVTSPGTRRVSVNGFDAVECPFAAQDSSVRGMALFLVDQGRVYRLLGYSVTSRWPAYARQAGMDARTARMIGNALEECLARL